MYTSCTFSEGVVAAREGRHCPICGMLHRTTLAEPTVSATICTDANTGTTWSLEFPLSRLGDAIALCGWTLTNSLHCAPSDRAALRAEMDRLEEMDSLPIPDGRQFFSTYGRRI